MVFFFFLWVRGALIGRFSETFPAIESTFPLTGDIRAGPPPSLLSTTNHQPPTITIKRVVGYRVAGSRNSTQTQTMCNVWRVGNRLSFVYDRLSICHVLSPFVPILPPFYSNYAYYSSFAYQLIVIPVLSNISFIIGRQFNNIIHSNPSKTGQKSN